MNNHVVWCNEMSQTCVFELISHNVRNRASTRVWSRQFEEYDLAFSRKQNLRFA